MRAPVVVECNGGAQRLWAVYLSQIVREGGKFGLDLMNNPIESTLAELPSKKDRNIVLIVGCILSHLIAWFFALVAYGLTDGDWESLDLGGFSGSELLLAYAYSIITPLFTAAVVISGPLIIISIVSIVFGTISPRRLWTTLSYVSSVANGVLGGLWFHVMMTV
jgi:hypothetical protein